jgi:hypothetical protein
MLERRYTIPVLFGIFLGLILAGVQVSATALNSAVGHHRGVALVAFENVDSKGAVFWMLGKRVKVSLPEGPWEIAAERTADTLKSLAEKAGGIYGRCREKAGRASDDLTALAGRGKDRFMAIYRYLKPSD